VKDGTVTIRDRDTLKQDRLGADGLLGYLRERLPA
jgi:glycyl-tRNA synthetase (class II)